MKFVASQGGPKVPADATVTSTVGIGPRSAGGFGLDIDLEVSLPGIARAEAEALVEKRIRYAPIPMPPAAMWTCASRSCDAAANGPLRSIGGPFAAPAFDMRPDAGRASLAHLRAGVGDA